MIRILTPSEKRALSATQKKYLLSNPLTVSLQPQMVASEALYQTHYGARTIDDAIEMDQLSEKMRNSNKPSQLLRPVFDNYSNAEDCHIDHHGASSGLY